MKRKVIYLSVFLALIVLFLKCYNVYIHKNDLSNATPYKIYSVDNGITIEYMNHTVTVDIPMDFTIQKRDLSVGNGYTAKYLTSNENTFDEIYEICVENKTVGAIGVFESNVTTDPPELTDIYGSLVLDNDYNFCISEEYYNNVDNEFLMCVGVTKVYYSPMISSNVGYGENTIYNDGIIAYENIDNFVIALEFEQEILSKSELMSVAESIRLC